MTDQPDQPEQPETAATADAMPAADASTHSEGEASAQTREVPHLVLTAKPVPEPRPVDNRAADKAVAKQKKLDDAAEQSPFSVFVGQVYDGPLDLLLDRSASRTSTSTTSPSPESRPSSWLM